MKLVDWSLAIYEGLHHQFFFFFKWGEGETMALMGNTMVSEGCLILGRWDYLVIGNHLIPYWGNLATN